MTTITTAQFYSLRQEIYTVLINGYDENGQPLGMGEMGNCTEAADQIIHAWCEKEHIEITH